MTPSSAISFEALIFGGRAVSACRRRARERRGWRSRPVDGGHKGDGDAASHHDPCVEVLHDLDEADDAAMMPMVGENPPADSKTGGMRASISLTLSI